MGKMQFNEKNTLKITNVLMYKILLEEKDFDLGVAIEQMRTYIKTKAAKQMGPFIQYTKPNMSDEGKVNIEITLLLQCNNYIHNVEVPYKMESVIRVVNSMYCRYNGPEKYLKFAYDKIQLEAFENNISLKGDSYTVFVDSDEENETIIADVFMERAD